LADNNPTGPGTDLVRFTPQLNEDNPEPRTMCILLLDSSASMREPKERPPIDALNRGLVQLAEELCEDPTAQKRVEIAVISFGGQVTTEHEFREAADFTPFTLTAGGSTPLAAAILEALDKFDERKAEYIRLGVNFHMPWLIIMTDGQPKDPPATIAASLERLQRWQAEQRVIVYSVGVGDNADFEFLKKTSNLPPMRVETVQFGEFFAWVSGNMIKVSTGPNHASSDAERARGMQAGEQTELDPPRPAWTVG
jgi:uncharacterized protein YegL